MNHSHKRTAERSIKAQAHSAESRLFSTVRWREYVTIGFTSRFDPFSEPPLLGCNQAVIQPRAITPLHLLFFCPAHHCDLNMPRCLFSVLHRCQVVVLSVQKRTEDTAQAIASPGLASPSLKLTTAAPSAAQGSLEMVDTLCTGACVCKSILVLVP